MHDGGSPRREAVHTNESSLFKIEKSRESNRKEKFGERRDQYLLLLAIHTSHIHLSKIAVT